MNYTDERMNLTANVRRATLRDDLRRLQQREAEEKLTYSDGSEWYFRCYGYVDATAATPAGQLVIDGVDQPWPPTYEQFVDLLPAVAVDEWLNEVYRLNPAWKPAFKLPDETQEKKDEPRPETGPLTGSSTS